MDNQTIKSLCERLNVTAVSRPSYKKVPQGWFKGTRAYSVCLSLEGRTLTVPFYQGQGLQEDPTASVVLSCLVSDVRTGEGLTFEEFVSEFGYDQDSRESQAIYRQCVKLAPKVKAFLGDHFDAFNDAEMD